MNQRADSIAIFKAWLFPSLVTILGMMIWNDVNEIKQDVKALMAQSNIDKTRIDNLERSVFSKAALFEVPTPSDKVPEEVAYHRQVAIKPDEEPIKIVKKFKRK